MEKAEKDFSQNNLIKSKKRVDDHGEVFTPTWMVEDMLDLTEESDRIESRVLEPACGNGNFLIAILNRKFAVIELKKLKAEDKKKHLALIAIMSLYGIELLEDNITECRKRLLSAFADFLKIKPADEFYRAAVRILSLNLVHGDALKMCTNNDRHIVFAEWVYLGKGKFLRKDFRFDLLVQSGANGMISEPLKTYSPMTIREIVQSKANMVREVAS